MDKKSTDTQGKTQHVFTTPSRVPVIFRLDVIKGLAISAMGPDGTPKIIRMHKDSDSVRVTTSSQRIFKNLPVRCAITNLAISMALSHKRFHGDAGLFVLSISCGLMKSAVGSSLPIRAILEGLRKALRTSILYLRSDNCPVARPVKWKDPRIPVGIVVGCISPKMSSSPSCAVEHLAKLVARAFLLTFKNQARTGPQNTVRIHPVIDHCRPLIGEECMNEPDDEENFSSGRKLNEISVPILRSTLIRATVLDIPLPPGVPIAIKSRLNILIYNVNLTFEFEDLVGKGVKVEKDIADNNLIGDSWSATDVQISLMNEIFEAWVKLDVKIVACQKLIHPYLGSKLIEHGMIPLPRLSIRHIDAVRLCTGAVPCSSTAIIGDDIKSSIGVLEGYEQYSLGNKRYLLMHPGRSKNHTDRKSEAEHQGDAYAIMIRVRDEEHGAEVVSACRNAMAALRATIRQPRVLAGAGATEAILASHLLNLARISKKDRPYCFALKILASQLCICARTVNRNHGHRPQILGSIEKEIVDIFDLSSTELRRWKLAVEGKESADTPSPSRIQTQTAPIDTYSIKLSAIETAVGIASTLLRIGNVVHKNEEVDATIEEDEEPIVVSA